MSVWRFASFQSMVDSVYSSHFPSGLGVGEPACRMCWTSRNVIGRFDSLRSLAAGFCAVALWATSETVNPLQTSEQTAARTAGNLFQACMLILQLVPSSQSPVPSYLQTGGQILFLAQMSTSKYRFQRRTFVQETRSDPSFSAQLLNTESLRLRLERGQIGGEHLLQAIGLHFQIGR